MNQVLYIFTPMLTCTLMRIKDEKKKKTHMIFYFCVSSCNYEQLHYLVSVETHCIVQGCVTFLKPGFKKSIFVNDLNKL